MKLPLDKHLHIVYSAITMTKTVRFQMMIEPELFLWLKKQAEKKRMSMSELVRQALWSEKINVERGGEKDEG